MPPPPLAGELPVCGFVPAAAPRSAAPSWLRGFLRFMGPGYLVAVGYMDPGNWATSVAAGSAYGYSLLWIVALSSVIAAFLQVLCARLGIVTGMDLAQVSRLQSSRASAVAQWLACECAICACDLAEVIGSAIALKLLFGLPMPCGVVLTVLAVFAVLWLQQRGMRHLEALVAALLGVVLLCFVVNVAIAQPAWGEVFQGFVPAASTATDPAMLYLAIGIVGATVMPHNLYLHSSVVTSRKREIEAGGKRNALKFATADALIALALAFFVNAAILVTAGAVFHANGHNGIAQLEDAYQLIGPLTGTTVATFLFALALLASGQSSAVTATLAGQVVMEGYLRIRLPPATRCLLTRSIAVIPALAVTLTCGEAAVGKLLLASQVVLSLQLPFAMAPLIRSTSSRKLMGEFANSRGVALAAALAMAAIVGLNAILVWQAFAG